MKKLLFTFTSLVISAMLIGLMPLAAAQNSTDTTLPNWIKKNAKWWSEGSIEDRDFVQGIQYIIQKGIMKTPSTKSSDKQSEEKISQWVKNNAGGWQMTRYQMEILFQEIQYLISKGIMKVNPPPTAKKDQPRGY